MCGIESTGGLVEDRQGPLRIEPSFLLDQSFEVDSIDQFHRDEELAICFARLKDGNDVGVTQMRSGLSLEDEALPEGRVIGKVGCHQLQSDDISALDVAGSEYHAHSAPSELFLDDEVAESLTDAPIRGPLPLVVSIHGRAPGPHQSGL
jgi:hypothetical protein